MNGTRSLRRLTRPQVSLAVAELMPHLMRGVQLDFFVQRGVTQTQFLMMAAIRSYERCTMSTLARNLHSSLPTASGIVDRLVRAGYVARAAESTDRRCVFVTLTRKGEAFFDAFEGVIRRRWEEALQSLEADELEAFYDVVRKLREHMKPK